MLSLVGLGLNDENDVTRKAFAVLRDADVIYCELFTNKWHGDLGAIEKDVGKNIIVIDRQEAESAFLIEEARTKNVALLVPGDPLAATTHFSLLAACKRDGVAVNVVHASSILTAVAETGLHLYKFGRTTTLCFPSRGFEPQSPYEAIRANKRAGLHTLILLDVQEERYMAVADALALLQEHAPDVTQGALLAASRLGAQEQKIAYGTVEQLLRERFDVPAVVIVPGTLHFTEEEALRLWM